MSTIPAQDELYTVVENLADGERVYGFLGARGMRLGVGEVVAIPGNLIATLGAKSQAGGRRRQFEALERALASGILQIRSTPAPLLWDATAGAPQILTVDDGALGVADPTYASSSSAAA
jgi:hypothetical protein